MELRTVIGGQGATAALADGSVRPQGVSLALEEVPLLAAFRRMVRGLEFDVCELAFTTYLCAREHGVPFTALPVFPVRGFHHGAILRNARLVHAPGDLEGRRVGVNRGWTVTSGVWARGILARDFGVDLGRVTWVLSGDEHVAEYRPPANVVAAEPGADLGGLLAAGELAAAIGVAVEHPDAAPLFPDPEAEALAALRGRGLWPVNHLVVVRDELLDAHPELAGALTDAFAEAKRLYVERLRSGEARDATLERVMALTGGDPLPYGVEPNRATIEELIDHAVEQGILERRPAVEELFAEA